MVSVFDSLYNDVIADEIESQMINLMGPNVYSGMQVISLQQQQNGSDCGVFAAAFATSILHYIPPETVQFDRSRMRRHLLECLTLIQVAGGGGCFPPPLRFFSPRFSKTSTMSPKPT